MTDFKQLYQEELLDHYKYPRNKGSLPVHNFSAQILNPACGDQVTLQGILEDGIITACVFEGKGCVICMAAASMLTEKVIGLSSVQVQGFTKETMLELLKIHLGPNRLQCALLPLEVLHKALQEK